jgi:hypothetical protein
MWPSWALAAARAIWASWGGKTSPTLIRPTAWLLRSLSRLVLAVTRLRCNRTDHRFAFTVEGDDTHIVAGFKHRDVSSQKPFADATKETHQIAAAGPNAFYRVVVDFANAITVIIARPLAASWSVERYFTRAYNQQSRGSSLRLGCSTPRRINPSQCIPIFSSTRADARFS